MPLQPVLVEGSATEAEQLLPHGCLAADLLFGY
jgi:hypothetical protein